MNISKHNIHVWLFCVKQDLPFESARFLRQILSKYLGKGPHEIVLTHNAFGKPSLSPSLLPSDPPLSSSRSPLSSSGAALAQTRGSIAESDRDSRVKPEDDREWPENNPDHIEFNLTHTDGLSILAITKGVPIGVDVERIQAWRKSLDDIVRTYFSLEEITVYDALPSTEKSIYFYKIWTLKEAFMKARGEGMRVGLRNISVAFDEEGAPCVTFQGELLTGWTLHSFTPKPGYIAAIITPQAVQGIEVFEVDEEELFPLL